MDVLESAFAGRVRGHGHAGHGGARADRRRDPCALADRDTRSAAGRRHRRPLVRRLVLLAMAVALPVFPGGASALQEPGPELDIPVTLSSDSLLAIDAVNIFAPAPFSQRRVANPNYRPPTLAGPAILPATQSTLRALDHFRAQMFHQTPSSPSALTMWE